MSSVNVDFFMDDIKSKNKLNVNQGLQVILNDQNRSSSEAIQAFDYVVSIFPEVVDAFDPNRGTLNLDSSQWTDEYYYLMQYKLTYNFCRERFLHQIKVRDYLASKGHPNFVFVTTTSSRDNAKMPTAATKSPPPSRPRLSSASSEKKTASKKKNSIILPWALGLGATVAVLAITLLLLKK
jgi:hypothetical protein